MRQRHNTMHIPSFWRALWYLVLLAALTLATVLYTLSWSHGVALKNPGFGHVLKPWSKPGNSGNASESTAIAEGVVLPAGMHPISHLTNIATKSFAKMTKNEIHTLDQAAAMYRKKRGRHPPPLFDAWYAYATSHNALIIEDFWDQIYDDLGPFWSQDPVLLRKQAHVLYPRMQVRDGNIDVKAHSEHAKLDAWVDMIEELVKDARVKLPDMDIPLSTSSSPAMLVPWEAIDTALSMSRKMMPEPRDMVTAYSSLDDIEGLTGDYDWKPTWLGPRLTHPDSWLGPRPLWSVVRPACPPGSPARQSKVLNDIWTSKGGTSEVHSPAAMLPLGLPDGSLKGYVKNWTSAVDVCQHPNIQGLHSELVSPIDMAVSTSLFPLFAGSKMRLGNEILLPGVSDWNNLALSDPPDWESRSDTLYYRTASTSAHEPARYWRRFQRERLVSMLNATHVEIAEASIHSGNESTVGVGYANNFRLLPANEYHLKAQTGGELAEWVYGWANAGLLEFNCEGQEGDCEEMKEYFEVVQSTPPEVEAQSKYAVSIDDDSLLHNFRSAKATLRSTIRRQWYDSRLVPWLHFIPLDHTFVDLYGIMEYFLGLNVNEGGKDFAHAIGQVQKHEHHFNTPESQHEENQKAHGSGEHFAENDHSTSSQSGNEPHIPRPSQPDPAPHPHPPKRSTGGHDDTARNIAEAGKTWADKVLRKEDMLIYTYRLLLEYARVVDDKRDRLGWVSDLK
tara:strand:+ start:6464 stop:8656 length:2193 start_codon:yes stop_codon:yes gene_type:complete